MGRISTEVISYASTEKLYELGMDAISNPGYFPNIRELKILERSEDNKYAMAEWTAFARISPNRTFTWIQEDHWDDERMCCAFSLSSDYSGLIRKMDGLWRFTPVEDGTSMIIDIDFEVDPIKVRRRYHRLADMAVKRNNDAMLNQIRDIAEQALNCRQEEAYEA